MKGGDSMDIIYAILGIGVIVWFAWALYYIADGWFRLYNELHDGWEEWDRNE